MKRPKWMYVAAAVIGVASALAVAWWAEFGQR